MAEICLMILFLIPAMLGLAEILHILKLYILKPQNPIIAYKVVILTDDMPLEIMKYVIEQHVWNKNNSSQLIFVNSLLSQNNFDKCKQFAEEYGIGFCTKDKVEEYLDLIVL